MLLDNVGAVYDVIALGLGGALPPERTLRAAAAASTRTWRRALLIEGCLPQLARASRRSGLDVRLPSAVQELLAAAAKDAMWDGLRASRQIPELARSAADMGIRVMALKGAARLLLGDAAGARSMGDIDLLLGDADAVRLHAHLRTGGYAVKGGAVAHHLPALMRGGSLPVELHVRLGERRVSLDETIWRDARLVDAGGASMLVPSPTCMMLHCLDHAVALNYDRSLRLRDVLDTATLWTPAVDAERVERHVRTSADRVMLEHLLAAARDFNPAIPAAYVSGGATVRRAARVRIAAASLVGSPVVADRLMRYAGTLALGSWPAAARLGRGWPARALAVVRGTGGWARRAVALAIAVVTSGAACLDSSGLAPAAGVSPLLYVADESGSPHLFRFDGASVARVSSSLDDEDAPSVAGDRVAFTSTRAGQAEIYVASLTTAPDAFSPQRITADPARAAEPSLADDGRIAFVSTRGGTPRIWIAGPAPASFTVGTGGDTTFTDAAVALATGSASFVPERAPEWSPAGTRIAFSSTRSGVSQIYVVPAAGGAAVAVTLESGGAFEPSWLSEAAIVYVALTGTPALKLANLSSGASETFASDSAGLSEPDCDMGLCVAVANPFASERRVVVVNRSARNGQPIPMIVAGSRRPSIEP